MIPTTILLSLVAFLLSILLILRRLLAKQERKLGYPKVNETFEDVKILMLLQQDIFALRCYRRIYPKASFAEAKYMINKLRQQFNQLQEQMQEQVQESARPPIKRKADAQH